MKNQFPDLNLTSRTVQCIVDIDKKQTEEAETAGTVRMTRRASLCGGQAGGMILTEEFAKKMIEINDTGS